MGRGYSYAQQGFEDQALAAATPKVAKGEFRVCTLRPDGRWQVEAEVSRRLALASLPESDDETAVLIEIWYTPVLGVRKAKVLDTRPGRVDPRVVGRHVARLLSRVVHPSVYNQRRFTC